MEKNNKRRESKERKNFFKIEKCGRRGRERFKSKVSRISKSTVSGIVKL